MASIRKECSIENYFKKNRDFFAVFVVLRVSCSCIPYHVHTETKSLGFLFFFLFIGIYLSCLFQGHNKRTCWLAPHCPFDAERQAGKL